MGLALSFSADKQLYILSPGSSQSLIFLPPYLHSWSFSICMSTDGSLSLAASGEKGVREGKERQRPTVNLGTLSTIYQSRKSFFFYRSPQDWLFPNHSLYFEKALSYDFMYKISATSQFIVLFYTYIKYMQKKNYYLPPGIPVPFACFICFHQYLLPSKLYKLCFVLKFLLSPQ